jgi:peptidylprolyl isomerase
MFLNARIFPMVIRLLLLVSFLLNSGVAFAKKTAKIGDKVAVTYIGSLKDGRIFDHNVGMKDLVFTLGENSMIKSFENAFVGMKVGETKTFDIPAKDAYGEFAEAKLFRIPASELPAGTKVGDTLRYRIAGGFHPVRIIHIDEKEVYIDANHKLAGKDLRFEVTLLDILKPDAKN